MHPAENQGLLESFSGSVVEARLESPEAIRLNGYQVAIGMRFNGAGSVGT